MSERRPPVTAARTGGMSRTVRILLVTQYFPPEITACAARMLAWARGLTEAGHEVEVLTAMPNHPSGIVPDEYRGRLLARERTEGFGVRRVWLYTTPKKGARNRIANYASFAGASALFGSARGKADVVVATSPPLSVGAAGAALAKRHRAPWVMDVRDLWPDVAAIVGEVPEGTRLYRSAERLERRLYRSAAAVVTTTEPFRRKILERGGSRVEVIPNGTTALWLEAAGGASDRAGLGLPGDRFVWTYAGNIGLAQGLDAAVGAAERLGEGFQLVLLGDGPRREALREQAASLPDGSVVFRDPVPAERAAELMRASDALLVSLAADAGMDGFVPSKLFDSAAVGRPVVVATGGESARLAEEADAALAVPPGDPDALATAIRRLRDDSELANGLGERGRAFAATYDRAKGAEQLARLVESLA